MRFLRWFKREKPAQQFHIRISADPTNWTEAAERIRDELLKIQRRNGGAGIS